MCEQMSPIRYGFRASTKAIRESVNHSLRFLFLLKLHAKIRYACIIHLVQQNVFPHCITLIPKLLFCSSGGL